jgi:hypothetical protein
MPTRAQWITLAVLAAAVFVLRAPSLVTPILNEDEALYAATAASMAEGQPPYRAGVESKPPGIFYLYEAGFAVVGRFAMCRLHALTMLWVLGTALVVGAIARRALPGSPSPPARLPASLVASLLYVAFTMVEEPAVMATQCELLYSLPLAIAAWMVIRGAGERSRRSAAWILAAGFLCGLATLIKPTAISLPAATTAWLVLRRGMLRGTDKLVVDVARAAALWTGFALACFAAYLYFSQLGVWSDLVYWAFRWTLGLYIPTGTAHSPFLVRFVAGFCVWVGLTTILWLLSAIALRTALARRASARATAPIAPRGVSPANEPPGPQPATGPSPSVTWLLVAWTLTATALTFVGGRFYDHYFSAVIPPLAALAAVGFEAVRARVRWRRAVAIGVLVPTVACWAGTWQIERTKEWFGEPPRPYDQIAAYVHDHSEPSDRVFVWGYFPLIYVAADRLAATRFVGCHYVTGYAAIGLGQDLSPEIEDRLGVPHGWADLLADLETYRPVLLVDTAPADLHHWRRYPLARYPVLADYVAAHYVREATVQAAVIYRRR